MVLELFGGSGRLSASIRRRGLAALPIDFASKPWFNFDLPGVRQTIRGWIRGGVCSAVWIALPCSSWSQARHGPPGSSWCTIRSRDHIWGLPGLGPRPQAAVDFGISQLRFALALISLCRSLGVLVYLENPGTSWVWSTPRLQGLVEAPDAAIFNLDMYAFGARWRKFTKVACWGRHHPEAPLVARCSCRKG